MTTASVSLKISPHPLLLNIVDVYSFREMHLKKDEKLVKLVPYRCATSIDFYLGVPHRTIELSTGKQTGFHASEIRGYRTFSKYVIEIENYFKSFSIKFKPGAMFQLFGIPMNELTNQDFSLESLDILPVMEIREKLMEANSLDEMKKVADQYLLNIQRKHSRLLPFHADSEKSIVLQAEQTGKSIRQLERMYNEQVGLGPKRFQNLQRFDRLIQLKKNNTNMNWTGLCYEAGYYDQPHMIRDFKSYLNLLPKQFHFSEFAM